MVYFEIAYFAIRMLWPPRVYKTSVIPLSSELKFVLKLLFERYYIK